MELLAHVEKSIRSRKLLVRGQPVLVAVSGGLDSMVLLRLLHGLSAAHGWKLTVAHFNHQLRGRSSDADERFVGKAARMLRLPFIAGRGDVQAFAEKHALSVEMAARALRHEFFARTARQLKICTVAVAHHADDQVELFFIRMLRGAGGEGLAGMKWIGPSPNIRSVGGGRREQATRANRLKTELQTQIVRPLLDVTRLDLEQYARVHNVRFRQDASNASLAIQRNRIRHELLPLLAARYQPALKKMVLRLMDIIGAEAELAADTARRWLDGKRRPAFHLLPAAVQRRCLQLQLLRLNVPADFEIIESLRASPGRPVNINPNASVFRDVAGRVQVRTPRPVAFNPNQLALDLKGRAGEIVFDGVHCHWRIAVSKPPCRLPSHPTGCESFDADQVGPEIHLRHWRPGDRFQPLGLASPVKLQDWFTNRKVPRARRHELLVAATAAGEIFWIEGQRIAAQGRLTARTQRRLIWHWRRG